jgi:hypothetical protein
MRKDGIRLPSAALIVASVALGVALVGSSYAATQMLPRGSVGTAQIRNGAVTSAKLRAGAVTSSRLRANSVTTTQVKNGTLLRSDFRPGQLAFGDGTGPQGPPGPAGPAGPPGVTGLQRVDAASGSTSAASKAIIVTCPTGKHVIGGGARVIGNGANRVSIVENFPDSDGVHWNSRAAEVVATTLGWQLQAYALCATVSS